MTQTATHTLTLVESEREYGPDYGFTTYCSCGWNDQWHRVGQYGSLGMAETAARTAGTDHADA